MHFNEKRILAVMESLQRPSGAFIASPSPEYASMWLRDHLFMTRAYYDLGLYEKLAAGMHVAFNVFHKHRHKLERVQHPEDPERGLIAHELIHAKYNPDTLDEVTMRWGHHQLDTIGLFLHLVADFDFKNIKIVRDRGDLEILQLLVFYLKTVAYWTKPDNGIWEEHSLRHSSSIGAVVGGLSYIQRRCLAVVPNELIGLGRNELHRILPYESRDKCDKPHHSHDCDAAQLFLIWPFNVVERSMADTILSRIIDGHYADNGSFHRLVQKNGINRYWGDDYFGSKSGVSAEWQWDFLVSIVFSQRHDYDKAQFWFLRGAERITAEGYIAEAYQDGKPNKNTPLGWMHALALIAWTKLPDEYRK